MLALISKRPHDELSIAANLNFRIGSLHPGVNEEDHRHLSKLHGVTLAPLAMTIPDLGPVVGTVHVPVGLLVEANGPQD